MSAINFPDPSQSPWTNSSTGITYTYSNGVWKALSSEETFLKQTDAESTYLKQADANFVSLSDGGTQQVISGGGGLNVDGDVQKKGNTVPSAVMGASAPSNPGICDFWTDTSGDTPVLKSWNGTEWVEVGSSGASEFAPVISNVTLTENDTTGDRFTSQTFDVDITMLREGEPFSQKGLKGEVTAEFAQYPAFESVASNNVQRVSDNQTGTRLSTSWDGGFIPVWAPLSVTSYGYVWVFWPNGGDRSQFRLMGADDLSKWPYSGSGATEILDLQTSSQNHQIANGKYFPPNENHNYGYLFYWNAWNNGNVSYMMRFRYSPGAGWNHYDFFPYTYGISQDPSDKQYYFLDQSKRLSRSLDFSNVTQASNSLHNFHTGDSRGMVGVGNGYAVIYYTCNQTLKIRSGRVSTNFNSNAYVETNYVGGSSRRPNAVGFAAGYFWIVQQEEVVYRSSDGYNWANVGTLGMPGATCYNMDVDKETGNPLFFSTWGNRNFVFTTSNAGGSFQLLFQSGNDGNSTGRYGRIEGDKLMFTDYWSQTLRYFDWNVQTITLSGTGEDYASFNVGDSVRPAGSSDPNKIGVISSISGTSIGVTSGYVYQAGDVIEAINPSGSAVASRYLVIDATGAVSGTVGSDPGYVSIGPNTNKTLTFPATFDTNNAPDAELPAGTTLKVSAQATNSIGSSEFGPSNVITPS